MASISCSDVFNGLFTLFYFYLLYQGNLTTRGLKILLKLFYTFVFLEEG